MKNLLISFESKYGQTEKIARYVADLARERGVGVRLGRVTDITADEVASADAFIVLAPIFTGRHPKTVYDFVGRYGSALRTRPTAFFSVSGSAGSKNIADRTAARKIANDFVSETGMGAIVIDTFAGAISYPKYNWLLRIVMKRISKKEGGSSDTTKTDERTDWNVVDASTVHFFDMVEGRSETAAA